MGGSQRVFSSCRRDNMPGQSSAEMPAVSTPLGTSERAQLFENAHALTVVSSHAIVGLGILDKVAARNHCGRTRGTASP